MAKIDACLQGVRTAAIAGHVNPDGDCIGSCMGLYLYLRENFPEIRTTVYLEAYRDVFSFIEGIGETRDVLKDTTPVDLLILLDISSRDRIGVAGPLLATAGKTLCFDHHVTNPGGFTWFYNEPQTSSASEVLYGYLDPERITPACAAALYTGIVHDTGMFQYASTSPQTMRIAASLMEKGIPFSRIVDETYCQRTYTQAQALGKVLLESRRVYDGRGILGILTGEDIRAFGLHMKDMDGFVSELRNTIGVEIAAFLYEKGPNLYKVSLRSRSAADVSKIAHALGGGGHVRAAGCDLHGTAAEAADTILQKMKVCLEEAKCI